MPPIIPHSGDRLGASFHLLVGENMIGKTARRLLVPALLLSALLPRPAAAQAEPFVGQMMLVGFTFCPRGWADADGQLLPIAQNTALFSLLGTTYGGDGRTTFALPDLRGRVPLHEGQGSGLSDYRMGQTGGAETVTLGINNLPPHRHNVQATDAAPTKGGPSDKYLASSRGGTEYKYDVGPPTRTMAADMITETGGGQAVENRPPYLAMRWCIALQGIFPSRN